MPLAIRVNEAAFGVAKAHDHRHLVSGLERREHALLHDLAARSVLVSAGAGKKSERERARPSSLEASAGFRELSHGARDCRPGCPTGACFAAFAPSRGERLANGNTLVTYSMDGVIAEVSPAAALVQTLTFPGARFGYSTFRETLHGPPP